MIPRKTAIRNTVLCGAVCFILGCLLVFFVFLGGMFSVSSDLSSQIGFLRQLGEVYAVVEQNYYREVDTQGALNSAAKGVMSSLNDRYAAYYTEEEYARLTQQQSGSFVGIGVVIAQDEDTPVRIVKVYDDSPAQRAGIEPNDTFYSINGEDVHQMSSEEITAIIRSAGVVPMNIVLLRGNEQISIVIASEQIVTHRVHPRMEGETAVVVIDEFTGDSVEGFENAIEMAAANGAKNLVIDLRNNPGGNLNDVWSIANMVMDEGVLMSMRTRDGQESVTYTDAGKDIDLPIAVLINGDSASASEVLAGALQDREEAVILGTQSFGKGIVQTTYSLLNGDGHVKLTTASYFTPNGRSIHGTGITPDIIIDLPPDVKGKAIEDLTLEEDTQLAKALEILNQ